MDWCFTACISFPSWAGCWPLPMPSSQPRSACTIKIWSNGPALSVHHLILITMASTLYLIPAPLDEHSLAPLPPYILDSVKACEVFFVENERTARRYLKSLWKEMVIDNYK